MTRTPQQEDIWVRYAQVYDVLAQLDPYRQMMAQVNAAAKLGQNAHVLNLGCGTGNLEVFVHSRRPGVQFVSIDTEQPMLDIARQKCPWVDFVVADLDGNLPELGGNYDAVVSVNVLYALNDPASVLRWAQSQLKPGGRQVHTTPMEGFSRKEVFLNHLRHSTWKERARLPWQLGQLKAVERINRDIFRRYRVGISETELREILRAVPVDNFQLGHCYAGQNWLASWEATA